MRGNLIRLLPDGSHDSTFDVGEGPGPDPDSEERHCCYVTAIAVQADGKILVGGAFGTFDGLPRQDIVRLHGGPYLHFGPPSLEAEGKIRLPLASTSGQRVRLQRSENLTDWEDWQTLVMDGPAAELIEETTTSAHRFYRALEDGAAPVGE